MCKILSINQQNLKTILSMNISWVRLFLFWVMGIGTFIAPKLFAQDAYNQWKIVQNPEFHLLGNYKEKRIFSSSSGRSKDLKLVQIQAYKNGRMVWDVFYDKYPNMIIYAMDIRYTDSTNAVATNLLDSTQSTYAFTDAGKMQYFVVDKISNQHLILTYNDKGFLMKCKDCLSPFKDHQTCAYYMYYYNEDNTLQKAESYTLESDKMVDTKILYAVDSLVYENGLLKTRYSLNTAKEIIQKIDFQYNTNYLLEKEISAQTSVYAKPRSYTKNYTYHSNNQLKTQTELYFIKEELDGKQIILHDKKGRKVQQEFYNKEGVLESFYKIRYKG